ncbi:MAG TPA: chloride channel protein [Desulfuromonadales bacterium]|nr:chloride channel protein [Desulfuromonadales bacterium]
MMALIRLKELIRTVATQAVGRYMVLSALVGVMGGLGAVGFHYATDAVNGLVLEKWAGFHAPGPGGVILGGTGDFVTSLAMGHRWFLFLVPALGGLISGVLVYLFAPEAEGHGTDAAVDAFHQKGGNIRTRVPWIKGLASVATIGTGGSAGKEGPIAQIGAGFGSFLAKKLKLPTEDRRILLLAGIAGGIGATFHAPLGGALFAVEVVYRDPEFEYEALVPCLISSIVAYTLFSSLVGWTPILTTPHFHFNHPAELILFLALGLVCAGMGWIYLRTFYGLRSQFRRLPLPIILRPALGGLLLGLLACFVPQVLGSGYGWIQGALYGRLALWVMVVVAFAKILATSLTIPSGGSGGVFAPSLVVGALIGGVFGTTAHSLFPTLVHDPRAYVLVGMAGFFAGVAKTPIASLVMASELTGDYGLLAPLMLVSVVAMLVFRRMSIYEKQVPRRIDSPAHLGDFVVDVLAGLTVADLAGQGHPPTLIPENLSLPEILLNIARAEGAYYPIVDSEGRMQGIFSVNDIRRLLDEDLPPGLVRARDIAISQVVTTTPSESLDDVLRKLTSKGFEEIPVVDERDTGRVLFMLSRRSLLTRYARELERQKGKSAPDVSWET